MKSCTDDFEDIIASLSWLEVTFPFLHIVISTDYLLDITLKTHKNISGKHCLHPLWILLLYNVWYYDYDYDVLTLNPPVSTEGSSHFPSGLVCPDSLILWPTVTSDLSDSRSQRMLWNTWVIFWSAVWNC